ncbi:DUF6285 domain-containing protein [Sphingobium sp. EM0848]|uniref:DUF6285 domain-containing protein n=1 Tax=Sphingobium sp. EM0848 TaxID=2743473 RepID=UPI00159CB0FF|nr:DUF6285 domain-containing protein [Sphingobium sp. EM0848]
MLDDPRPEELLVAIARLLREDVVPKLSGATAFQARVAANALDLIMRQIAGEATIDAEENVRLAALLGQDGTTADLNRLLAARLREGVVEAALPGLMDHLWETTLAKIAVDQPGYASIAQARAIRAARQQERKAP